jgi:hypothetical protein
MIAGMIVGMTVDWTQVLVVGVPAYIAATFAGIAVVLGSLNRRNLKTSNGGSIADAVEQTHAIATANAATLGKIDEATKE